MARKISRYTMLTGCIPTSANAEHIYSARLRSATNRSLKQRKNKVISLASVNFGSTLGETDGQATDAVKGIHKGPKE